MAEAFTEAELAEWERQAHGESAEYVTVHLAPKLIAALHAERAEVKRLRRRLHDATVATTPSDLGRWSA